MKINKFLVIAIVFVFLISLAACNGGGNSGSSSSSGGGGSSSSGGSAPATAPSSIKVGVPNPTTGDIAVYGHGSPQVEQLVLDYVNNELGGIYIEEYDTKLPIEFIYIDTESSDTKAAEVTQQLVTNNDVNMIIARHTPQTALPVSMMAESLQVPFIAIESPVESWYNAGPYEWGRHSFWWTDQVSDLFIGMWEELGYGPGSVIGALWADDPDGNAWSPAFARKAPERGYTYIDPGPYKSMQSDWTSVINMFKEAGVEIIVGIPVTPDMASFSTQAIQQGFDFDFTTTGRGTLFPASVETFPEEVIPKLHGEIFWTPWHPWASDLTGWTSAQLGEWWETTMNEPWTQVVGYKYASAELAVDAFIRAASLEPAKIRDAIISADINTMVGHIKYDPETQVSTIPLVGGTWDVTGHRPDGSPIAEFKVCYNKDFPEVPINREMKSKPN